MLGNGADFAFAISDAMRAEPVPTIDATCDGTDKITSLAYRYDNKSDASCFDWSTDG